MSRTRLILIPALATEPAPFLIVAPDGSVLQRGRLTLDAVEAPEVLPTVAIAPGADVAIHWLDLPKGSAAQVRAAALWALKDWLAATPDRITLALGPVASPRMVAVVSVALLQAWMDYLGGLGVRADVITPDVLVVPEPFDDDVLSAVAFGPNVALRGHGFAATIQPDLVEAVAGDRRIVPVEDADLVERMLATATRQPAVNLLSGMERERTVRGGWKRAMALAAAVLIAPLVTVLAGAARDDMAARRMSDQAEAEIARILPDLADTADPVAEVRRRADAAPPPGGTASAAAALFAAVESVEGAELDLLTVDPEGGMRAAVSYPGYGDLAPLKAAMAERGLSLRDTSTLDDNGRVVSDVVIGGGA